MNVAAIDIGSNSVRLLITDRGGLELYREATITGLGRGVDSSGCFREDTMSDTLDVLQRYFGVMNGHSVSRVGAVATSASRDASNGDALMRSIAGVIGTEPTIISGTDEAGLSFAGATANLRGDPPFLVIDIGGGSTEFVYGDAAPSYAVSIDIGSVRLTERRLPDRPSSTRQLDEAAAHTDVELSRVQIPGTPGTTVGVASTFTSLKAIALGLDAYDRDAVEQSVLTIGDIRAAITALSLLDVAETAAIPSLDPKRAPVILAGAVIAERALARTGVEEIVVSEHDLLDGLAASLLAR